MISFSVQIASAQLACQIHGEGKVNLVVEMGLGAAMAEWQHLARKLSQKHTVLLYQRAGYGASSVSSLARTPENIALELHELLEQIPHAEKLTLLAHSQGGLYAWVFARTYPEMVERLILLDPLSPEDYRFRLELTEEELRKSGADKSAGLELNGKLTRMHLGWLVKRMMASAPPFYYDSSFTKTERKEILDFLGKPQTYRTALSEYASGHVQEALAGLLKQPEVPMAPLTVVTHNSDISCREIRQFGGASEEQAAKIEALWQDIMAAYLRCAGGGQLIRAEHSSHYIHLTDAELICGLV